MDDGPEEVRRSAYFRPTDPNIVYIYARPCVQSPLTPGPHHETVNARRARDSERRYNGHYPGKRELIIDFCKRRN